jgi:TatD DNase family protein
MFVDTHCHINAMVKDSLFDTPLTPSQVNDASTIIKEAVAAQVTRIINVGTSLIESHNSILLARTYSNVSATVGIHPNDCQSSWKNEIKEFEHLLKKDTQNAIVGIGECGLDFHYPDYNISQQIDVFTAQIELALTYNRALVIHTRKAPDETLKVLESFRHDIKRAVVHCFSEGLSFAQQVIEWSFKLGLGGTITYPKNEVLREVTRTIPINSFVLETDAPFLPPQTMRGAKNHPQNIVPIAHYIAQLRNTSIEEIAHATTQSAFHLFRLEDGR